MTAKEVARLAKRRPHVLESSEFRRLVDVFLNDLEISKVKRERLPLVHIFFSRQPLLGEKDKGSIPS